MALLSTDIADQVLSEALLLGGPMDELNLDVSFPISPNTENELLTPELDLSEPGFGQFGSFSPVYSPQSVDSEDSGVLSNTDNDYNLLSSLFGADISLPLSTEAKDVSISVSTPSAISNTSTGNVDTTTHTAMPKEQPFDRSRKNAEAARLNRQKKKRYVEDLEKTCTSLKTDNVVLKTRCHEFQQRCSRLQSEVQYLQSVLMNESTLSSLIQNIPQVKEIKLSSSFARKRPISESESSSSSKRPKTRSHSGGVCLHVAKDVVSLEFCANCSKQASA